MGLRLRGDDGVEVFVVNLETLEQINIERAARRPVFVVTDVSNGEQRMVKAADLAPADPSPQDLRVAAQADAAKLQAQSEQRRQGGDTASGRAAAAYGAAQALGNSTGAGRGLTV